MKRFILIGIAIWIWGGYADAATISLDAPLVQHAEVKIPVDVYLTTEGENINSVELSVVFSAEQMSFVGYDQASSSIPLWVVPPTREGNSVHFSGVIPGGIERAYDPAHPSQSAIRLLRLYFVGHTEGVLHLQTSGVSLYKNDGAGSVLPVTSSSVQISIDGVDTKQVVTSSSLKPFVITLVPRSHFAHTPALASFAAEAEQGIDHYEIQIGSGAYTRAMSPVALPNRIFPYTLTVRAYGFDGGYTDQRMSVPGSISTTEGMALIGGILLLVGVIVRKLRAHTKI